MFIYLFMYVFIIYLFVYVFIYSFIYLFIYLFIHSFISTWWLQAFSAVLILEGGPINKHTIQFTLKLSDKDIINWNDKVVEIIE